MSEITKDVKIGFFQKSIVSLKSIFYQLSWRHYCSSTNAVLHVISGRRVSGALILKLIVMLLENMFFVTFFVINVYVFQYIKQKLLMLTLLLFIFKISGRSVDSK